MTPKSNDPMPTPTSKPIHPKVLALYEFDRNSLTGNGWSEPTGGFTGKPVGRLLNVNFPPDIFPESVDQIGLEIKVHSDEIVFINALNPITSDVPVLLRLSVRARGSNASVALAALQGSMLTGDNLDGSIAMNMPATSKNLINEETRLVLVYQPLQGNTFTPVIQVASTGSPETVIWIDKLEILKLDTFEFGSTSSRQ